MNTKPRTIDILKKAHEKKVIRVEFEIPNDDQPIHAVLSAPDIFSIREEQDKVYQLKLAECVNEGFDKYPVNESAWRQTLQAFNVETQKMLEKERPQNLAEQLAFKASQIRTIQALIPKFLKDKAGNLLFPTNEEQSIFKDILCSDPDLLTLLSNKYVELANRIAEVNQAAKN